MRLPTYTQIIDFLKVKYPNLTALSLDKDMKISTEKHKGDLSQMLYLEEEFKENTTLITVKKNHSRRVDNQKSSIACSPEKSGVSSKVDNDNLPKIIMFRDSFATLLQPFLSENFSCANYIWQDHFDTTLIQEHKPDIVIQQFVERKLSLPLPKDIF